MKSGINVTMMNDNLLVRVFEEDNKVGNLVLTKVTAYRGEVIAVPKDGMFTVNGNIIQHDLVAGDIVIFGENALNSPKQVINGEEYYIMKLDNIFMKMVNNE